jgi:lysozyme family protein
MGGNGYRKRDFLKAALLASFGAPAFAQEQRLFGIKIPKQLMQFIPAKPLNIAMMVESVIRLEGDADRKGLPDSPLQRNKGERVLETEGSIYQLVLPRLVALIDRSEQLDLGLADEAGSLLAELHASQHALPEALLSFPLNISSASDLPQHAPISPLSFAMQSTGSISLPDILQIPAPPDKVDDDVRLSKAKDFTSLKPEYARLFSSATVRPEHKDSTDWHLAMMQKSKARYQAVSDDTHVPWYFIAVCHALEASFNFRAHLHNGDFPLSARTRQVPAGHPTKWLPPSDWESSARDALRLLGFTGQSDWSLERTLYRIEAYNGFGYRPYGVASPYLWSFSHHYSRGKYVADGKWSATAKSQQCGAAVMLKVLSDAGEIEWHST